MSLASAPVESRQTVRRRPARGTFCHLELGPGGGPRLGLVWDLSAGGISLLLHEPLASGSAVRAELATVDERATLRVVIRVAHVAELKTGDYVVGGPFDEPLAPEQMRPFLGG